MTDPGRKESAAEALRLADEELRAARELLKIGLARIALRTSHRRPIAVCNTSSTSTSFEPTDTRRKPRVSWFVCINFAKRPTTPSHSSSMPKAPRKSFWLRRISWR
jgi:hypothetical protein